MTSKISFADNFQEVDFVNSTAKEFSLGKSTYIIRSSGSTGPPKEIELDKSMLDWSVNNTRYSLGLTKERILCCLPVRKTGGFMKMYRALYFNWDIHFVNPTSRPLEELPDKHDFTLASMSPMQLYKSLEYAPEKLNRFKVVLVGGAGVSLKIEKMIKDFHKKHDKVRIFESYGMTETASHVALRNISTGEKFFTPQMGVQVFTDENNQLIIDVQELGVQFKTNDLGQMSTFGFKILGRVDDVINSGGIKIQPGELNQPIEHALTEAGIYRRFYLTKRKDDQLGEALILVLEGQPYKDLAFVKELLKRELPAYHSPADIFFEGEFERTDTGKIIKQEY